MNVSDTNSSLSEEEFFRSVAASFFTWISDDLLPVVLIALYSVLVVQGIILNLVALVFCLRQRLHKETVHTFIIQLCVVDLIACIFVLLPTLVSVASDKFWLAGNDSACRFQVVIFTWCYLLTFGCLTVGIIERLLRLNNDRLHLLSFGNVCIVRFITICIWIVDLVIAMTTMANGNDITYKREQFQCALDYTANSAMMHFIFALTMYIPLIVYTVCFTMIFYRRGKRILKDLGLNIDILDNVSKDKSRTQMNNKYEPVKISLEGNTSVFHIDLGKSLNRSNSRIGDIPDKPNETNPQATKNVPVFRTKTKWLHAVQRTRAKSRVSQIFGDRLDDTDHHQSMMYLVTWSVVTLCWSLYYIAALSDVYGSGCSVCYRVGVLFGLVTYCIKPLIYIGHNRWYRAQYRKQLREARQYFCTCCHFSQSE